MTKMSGKSLLLLELSILLAFFLFAAVTCTYMFVKASGQAQDAEALSKAVVKTTSIAETLKAENGNLTRSATRMGGRASYETEEDTLTLYMDENMNPASKTSAAYTATVTKEASHNLWLYGILIRDNEDSTVVYELDLKSVKEGGQK